MSENKPKRPSLPPLETLTNARRKARQKRVQTIVKTLGYAGSGLGIPGTIASLVAGNLQAAIISGALTIGVFLLAIAYKFVSGVTNRVLDLIEEELENIEEPLANWIVSRLKTIWWKLNPQFQRQYYQRLIDTFRELTIEGFRIGLPVLDLENVFVSLRVATEIPEKIRGAMIPPYRNPESQEIWDFLAQSTQKKFPAYRRIAVIGPPGSGKTTLLKHLTLTYAKKQQGKHQASKLIPILLYLRDIRHLIVTEPRPNLPQLIKNHIQTLPTHEPLSPPPHWIEDQLKIGKCLVMLDGLDEVADSQEREKVSQWVSQQMEIYRRTPFILTSRPHGYRSAPVEQVGTVLEVLPFNPEQVKQFIQRWYLQTEIMSRGGRDTPAVRSQAQNSADDLIHRIREKRAIADMAKNPLLVTMIATVHYCGSALPGRRVELYQRICDLLLGSRQIAKKIATSLTGEQNKSVLQVLALALMEKKTREFTLPQGQEWIETELQKVTGNALNPVQFLQQIKEVSGLLIERELGIYEFAHLSFQEYLAAAQVKELQYDDLLTENLSEPWWAETIRLYAAQSDATKLIQRAMEQPTVHSLTLASDCLQEQCKVEPAIRQQLEEMLEAGLESPDPAIAHLAAEVKLSRRLNDLFKIDDNLEIDQYYLTCAEYQLFVDEQLNLRERFQAGSAKKPITGISLENVLDFCAWLSSKAQLNAGENFENQDISYYRLPTATEAQNYPAREHLQLGCWKVETSSTGGQGIRVVKALIPPEYVKLTGYLSAGEWGKADQETVVVMGKMANQEMQDFHTIDLLWRSYFRGKFSLFAFDVITVNARGMEIKKESKQALSFTQDLGNEVTLDMVAILGGKFVMGSPRGKGNDNERPQHEVTVSPFFMGKYPVTQVQWRAIASRKDLKVECDLNPDPSHFKSDRRPVEQVSWDEAVEFCKRLSNLTAKEYRLPSEAEWEYACRAGTTTPFAFGETITGGLANYNAANTYVNKPEGQYRGQTTAVGQFPPNAFGLYDMHGNVWEWCKDNWHDNYTGAPIDGSAWLTSYKNNTRILRGGSWGYDPRYCRSACRYFLNRATRVNYDGFRVVCVQP